MTPIKHVITWLVESVVYVLVLIALFSFFPEDKAYWFIRHYTGVITGDGWDKYYFLSLCIASLIITAIIVYIAAVWSNRTDK